MKFSIVVPVFNGEKNLRGCLESVSAQTLDDYELIIVDDGSTDNSSAIADGFAESHDNVLVLHGPNQGPFLARRMGLSHCKGEYVVFLDGDDAFAPNALQKIAEVIESTGADIVSFRFSRDSHLLTADDSSALDGGVYDGTRYDQVKKAILRAIYNNLWGKAFRLSRLDINADYESYGRLMFAEDLLQLLPIIDASSNLVRVDEVLYFYRCNEAGSTGHYRHSYLIDTETVAKRLLEYGDKWGMPLSALDGALTLYINLLRVLVRYGTHEVVNRELPLISRSLRTLSPDVLNGVRKKRPDLRMLLEGAISSNRRKVVFAVRATDAARKLAGQRWSVQ